MFCKPIHSHFLIEYMYVISPYFNFTYSIWKYFLKLKNLNFHINLKTNILFSSRVQHFLHYCLYIHLYLYIYFVCLSGCLFVCLYPINVETAEPIGPKCCVWPQCPREGLWVIKILWNPQIFLFLFYTVQRCPQVKPQIKVEIEDGLEAP